MITLCTPRKGIYLSLEFQGLEAKHIEWCVVFHPYVEFSSKCATCKSKLTWELYMLLVHILSRLHELGNILERWMQSKIKFNWGVFFAITREIGWRQNTLMCIQYLLIYCINYWSKKITQNIDVTLSLMKLTTFYRWHPFGGQQSRRADYSIITSHTWRSIWKFYVSGCSNK